MKFFAARRTIHFWTPVFGEGVMREGEIYYSYSQFARDAVQNGIGEIVSPGEIPFITMTRAHLRLAGKEIKKILLLFAGGLGDAVILGMVLPSIEKALTMSFDICCSEEKWRYILMPMGLNGSWVPYPPSMPALRCYDAVLTDITRFFYTREGISTSPLLQLCKGFGLDPNRLAPPSYRIDDAIRNRMRLPDTSGLRAGVNFDSNGAVKSYPVRMQPRLLSEFESSGFEIFLFGVRSAGEDLIDANVAHDLRGPNTIPELAALLEQMDVVVGVDSFVANLANALGIPVIVLLSTTSPSFFSMHRHITCLVSGLDCSPCFEVFDHCPKGNKECQAFYHPSISPRVVVTSAMKRLSRIYAEALHQRRAASKGPFLKQRESVQ